MSLESICREFGINGEYLSETTVPGGIINTTYKVDFLHNKKNDYYILQKINKHVFPNPELVMRNIILVTEHIKNISKSGKGYLQFLFCKNGLPYFIDDNGEYWRSYRYIGNAITIENSSNLDVITEAGRAFGQFQHDLCDFDASTLSTVIADFHNTKKRYQNLENAVQADEYDRLQFVKNELEYLLSKKSEAFSLCQMFEDGLLPLRVTHNDTKCNNILFDEKTYKALAVIDLDTVMPGLTAYDYGDAIRSIAATAGEDGAKTDLDISKFKAFSYGFLNSIGELSNNEKNSLPLGILSISLELSARFLTDYLEGDKYFKIEYAVHNLNRAKNQILLSKKIEEKMDELKAYISMQ